ncbi:MAG: hypothetical protein NVSMB9_05150 [Isosphaeraceae bacterium]
MRRLATWTLVCAIVIVAGNQACAEDTAFSRKADVIYGRKFGTALTMDVLTPRNASNGLGLICVVSGGWFSTRDAIVPLFIDPLAKRGYTVFAVVHGSQPRYTIPEIVQDMNRAVRFVRQHASDYRIDPLRLGIYGGSAGGHLSLMQGTAGDGGDPGALDPVDRASSRVQAVACFAPPTDFLNYGKPGVVALGREVLERFRAPFDFQELDKDRNVFVPIVDHAEIRRIGRNISPVYHVSRDDPPTLIIHGDADSLVPIQQAEVFVEAMTRAGAEARLVVKRGAGHVWPELSKDFDQFADWFDTHLKNKGTRTPTPRPGVN